MYAQSFNQLGLTRFLISYAVFLKVAVPICDPGMEKEFGVSLPSPKASWFTAVRPDPLSPATATRCVDTSQYLMFSFLCLHLENRIGAVMCKQGARSEVNMANEVTTRSTG